MWFAGSAASIKRRRIAIGGTRLKIVDCTRLPSLIDLDRCRHAQSVAARRSNTLSGCYRRTDALGQRQFTDGFREKLGSGVPLGPFFSG
jgi:hypothetical protein